MKFVLNLQLGYYFLDLKENHLAKLQKEFPQIEFVNLHNNDERIESTLKDADALATWPFDPDRFEKLIEQANKLRWIQFSYVGIAPRYVEIAKRKNLAITNARGIASESIALHALALILAFERNLWEAFDRQKKREWAHEVFTGLPHGFEGLKGKALGIVGLGSIGMTLAAKAHSLGMRIIGLRRNVSGKPGIVEKIFALNELPKLLSEADYVVLSIPLLDETKELIGVNEFSQMKKSAYLINMARGDLVNEEALIQALRSGRIAGAALDVVAREPLSKESPLYETPNLILTPHIAGLDRQYTDKLVDLLIANTRNYLLNKPLINQVDLDKGY